MVKTLRLGPGDACLVTNQTYGACANAVADACDRSGAELIRMPIDRAGLCDPARLTSLLKAQLAASPHVKFALLDHITSPTGARC